jgi:hypothetical protein
MLLAAFAGGAAVGFCVARSLAYERWLRDRRDLKAIRRQQEIQQQLRRSNVNKCARTVARPPKTEAG